MRLEPSPRGRLPALLGAMVALGCCGLLGFAPEIQAAENSGKIAAATAGSDAVPLQDWIADLGADGFSQREQAARRIADFGPAALPALRERLLSGDAEVRRRSRQLIGQIERADFEERMQRFVEDETGKLDHDIPGWERYRTTIGRSAPDRKLYLEMLKDEPELMYLADGPWGPLKERLQDRCQTLQVRTVGFNGNTVEEPSLGSIASILFLASQTQVEVSQEMGNFLTNLLYRQKLQTALQGNEGGGPVRRLLSIWLSRPWDSGPLAYQNLIIGLRHNFPAVLTTAVQVLQQKGGHPQMRMYALLAVGRFGCPTHKNLLEDYIEDETVCLSNRANRATTDVQLRDVAMVTLTTVEQKDPAAYGYSKVAKDANMMFQLPTLSPDSEDARKKGFEKWKAARKTDERID